VTKPLRKAVLPVAGLGTRFLPATKAMAKEMLPVVDKPLIQYAIEEARAAGIEQFCLVTGRGKTAIVEHFDIAFELEATLREREKADALAVLKAIQIEPGSMVTVRQQIPLGLGHAIWCARVFVGEDPFAILLPDDLILSDTPCLTQLARAYQETGGNVVAVTEVPREQTHRYGILEIGRDAGRLVEVTGLVEKPDPDVAPSNLSIIGRYVLMPEVIGHLARMDRGAGGPAVCLSSDPRGIGSLRHRLDGSPGDGVRADFISRVFPIPRGRRLPLLFHRFHTRGGAGNAVKGNGSDAPVGAGGV